MAGPIGDNPTIDPGYDPALVAAGVASLNATVASISAMAETYEARYATFIIERLIYDLTQAGYEIKRTV